MNENNDHVTIIINKVNNYSVALLLFLIER